MKVANANGWHNHVRAFARAHGCTEEQAERDPEVRQNFIDAVTGGSRGKQRRGYNRKQAAFRGQHPADKRDIVIPRTPIRRMTRSLYNPTTIRRQPLRLPKRIRRINPGVPSSKAPAGFFASLSRGAYAAIATTAAALGVPLVQYIQHRYLPKTPQQQIAANIERIQLQQAEADVLAMAHSRDLQRAQHFAPPPPVPFLYPSDTKRQDPVFLPQPSQAAPRFPDEDPGPFASAVERKQAASARSAAVQEVEAAVRVSQDARAWDNPGRQDNAPENNASVRRLLGIQAGARTTVPAYLPSLPSAASVREEKEEKIPPLSRRKTNWARSLFEKVTGSTNPTAIPTVLRPVERDVPVSQLPDLLHQPLVGILPTPESKTAIPLPFVRADRVGKYREPLYRGRTTAQRRGHNRPGLKDDERSYKQSMPALFQAAKENRALEAAARREAQAQQRESKEERIRFESYVPTGPFFGDSDEIPRAPTDRVVQIEDTFEDTRDNDNVAVDEGEDGLQPLGQGIRRRAQVRHRRRY